MLCTAPVLTRMAQHRSCCRLSVCCGCRVWAPGAGSPGCLCHAHGAAAVAGAVQGGQSPASCRPLGQGTGCPISLCACILDQLLGHPEHSQPVIDTPPAQPDHYLLPQCSGSHTTRSCAIPDVMTWCELLTCTLRRMWCASSAKGGRSCALTRRQTSQYSRYALACLWAPSVAGATPPRSLLDNEP